MRARPWRSCQPAPGPPPAPTHNPNQPTQPSLFALSPIARSVVRPAAPPSTRTLGFPPPVYAAAPAGGGGGAVDGYVAAALSGTPSPAEKPPSVELHRQPPPLFFFFPTPLSLSPRLGIQSTALPTPKNPPQTHPPADAGHLTAFFARFFPAPASPTAAECTLGRAYPSCLHCFPLCAPVQRDPAPPPPPRPPPPPPRETSPCLVVAPPLLVCYFCVA